MNKKPTINYQILKNQIVEETNKLRTKPKEYAKILEANLKFFGGKDNKIYSKPGKIGIITEEGTSAVKEAIEYLNKAKPLSALTLCEELSKAGQDHANDIGSHGLIDHTGSDGSSPAKRIERYVEWLVTMAENIDFGSVNGEEVILSLVIDDGVDSRGHRKNLFSEKITHLGVGTGMHTEYDTCSVINYVGGIGKKSNAPQKNKSTTSNNTNTNINTNLSQKENMLKNIGNKMDNMKISNDPFKDDENAPKNAISCSTKIQTKTVGKKVTKTTTKTYKCSDGSTSTVELIEESG
jgi:uncharacterized protein YkwD